MSPNQQGARGQIAHLTVKVIIRPSTQSGQLEKHLVSQRVSNSDQKALCFGPLHAPYRGPLSAEKSRGNYSIAEALHNQTKRLLHGEKSLPAAEEHTAEGRADGKCHEAYLAEILQAFTLEDRIDRSEGDLSLNPWKPRSPEIAVP
ncbi:hypothetical protein Anapl_05905 [Anas platyrhynchos]|uniref:Uncharacterized protein n=1 Tax=Anas platyrhynchos TaxID=8839 RepID=R0JTI5_ANAPL|nr:hypothetical protein Anapl_05905 [Anas platyrhynchos]